MDESYKFIMDLYVNLVGSDPDPTHCHPSHNHHVPNNPYLISRTYHRKITAYSSKLNSQV